MRWIFLVSFLLITLGVMAQPDTVNIGTGANTGDGDPLRTAFGIVNTNDDAAFDSLDAHLDTLQAHSDTLQDLRTDQNAKIALDEMHRLTVINDEATVADSDTIAIKVNGVELKVTRSKLLYLTNVIIGAQANLITALEDSIDVQRADMQIMELINDYDSIRINDAKDKFYLYVADETGQYRATLNIDVIDDPTNPTVVSMTVENANPDDIIIVMSEYLESADSSINRFSGAGGANWPGMDAAYNFDESEGNLLDLVGTDDGVLTGATYGSTGIAGNAYSFDGNDKVDFGTGINYGSNDLAGSVVLKPGSLGADFRIYSAPTGGFFIGYNASSSGLWAGIQGGALTSVTSIDLTVDVWNFVCWSYDQTANEITFWIDGVAEVESYSTTFTAVSDRLASSGGASYYTGLMDDLFLFDDYKFTQNRVDSLYNGGVGRRFNQSGGESLVFQDSIKAAFTISNADLGGTSYAVDSVFIENGNEIRLDLDSDIAYGEIIRVIYDESVNYGIRDTSDNFAASWSLYQITNNVTTENPDSIFIVKERDYTGVPLGLWSEASAETYYGGDIYGHYNHNNTYIVEQTLNGSTDTCLRITHRPKVGGEWGSVGAQITYGLDTAMYEAFLSFYVKLGKDYNGVGDAKMAGLRTVKTVDSDYPMDPVVNGWLARIQVKADAGYIDTYHYDFSGFVGYNPWSYGTINEVDIDTDFLLYGSFMKVDMRVKMNTWTEGVANFNGLFEVGLNDNLVYQIKNMRYHTINEAINLIGVSLSTFMNVEVTNTFYCYFDEIIVYIPLNSAKLGLHEFHTEMWDSPLDVPTDDLYTDSIIDIDSENITYSNDTGFENYRWRIDAGADNKVKLSWNSGDIPGGCYVIAYEGKVAGGDIIYKYKGYISDLSTYPDAISEGRYMYVYMVSDDGGGIDLSGNITFLDQYETAGIGNSLVNASDEAFDLLGEEPGYTMINLAEAGDKIEHQQDDWNAEIKISSAEKLALTHVIIAVGTNNAVTGTPDSATIVNKYKSLLVDINADISASCKVIMFTMIHCLGHDWVSASDMVVLKAVNTWIETVPTGVDYVSTANTIDMSDGDYLHADYDLYDGLHINAAGTAVFLQNIKDEIE